ncbi:sodium:solute symporter [Hoylesella buccalis]|uniref:sodium:solute symporter n=1 Tax=Hoylesella buccalis TaxID=28127 RepID=UPI00050F5DC1|nr:sodium:solute symporter [Hoylesella buccalis]KGF42860.1 sodium:solute symporter [Hoylesella buccalis DNF00985]
MTIVLTLLGYFAALLLLSRMTTRHATNDTFYRGNRQSPWYLVAFGMIGASVSGVTFVSVPGMVNTIGMTYLQTCLGFVLGYVAVAFVLLPIYYRLNLTTIYTYLQQRLGTRSYKTGAWFFLLSKMSGSAVKFYVVCMLLQRFVLDAIGVPFMVTALVLVSLIWLYTRRGGIKTLVWTDTFQTFCMFAALIFIIVQVMSMLDMNVVDAVKAIVQDDRSRIFVFDDWLSKQNFWKQFVSGIFIVIVMTGLDQDMMQKNLTCKTLHEAQKDMCTYGLAFVPVNLLFLALGVLLSMLAAQQGVPLPSAGDELLPMFAATGELGTMVVVFFTIGIVAASFSSADSALTALTTTYCVDICQKPANERLRHRVHAAMGVVFVLFILMFRTFNSTNLIDAIYILVSYTYGPLLGLFAFGLLTKCRVNDRWVPCLAIAAPVLCYVLDVIAQHLWHYHFGYELLLLNGLLTFVGLYGTRKKDVL